MGIVLYLNISIGILVVLFSTLAVYVSLKLPEEKHRRYWIGAFVLIGLLIIILTTGLAIESNKEQQQANERLRKVEFLQHRTDGVNHVVFFVWLDRLYTPEELGSFRILMTILRSPIGVIYMSAADAYPIFNQGSTKILLYGTQDTTWSADSNLKFGQLLQDTTVAGSYQAYQMDERSELSYKLSFFMHGHNTEADEIDAWSGNGGPFSTLQAFDNASLIIDLSASLWPKVAYIGLAVNNYLLFGQPRQCLTVSDPVHGGQPSAIDWPSSRRPDKDLQWVHVVPAGYLPGGRRPSTLGFWLQFSSYTPLLMETFFDTGNRRSLAIPMCDWYGSNKP